MMGSLWVRETGVGANATTLVGFNTSRAMKWIIGFLVASVVVVGCGSKTAVTDGQGNKAEVDQSGKVTVTDAEGKTTTAEATDDGKGMKMSDSEGNSMEMSSNSVTEAELRLPFYPGSTPTDGSMKLNADGRVSVMSVRLTSDEPVKVTEFYKSKVKETNESSMTADQMVQATVTGKLEDGAEVAVLAARMKGEKETRVTVTMSKKN